MAPTFAVYFKFIYHETDNENNKNGLFLWSWVNSFTLKSVLQERILRGRVQGLRNPDPEMTCGFLIQLYTKSAVSFDMYFQ